MITIRPADEPIHQSIHLLQITRLPWAFELCHWNSLRNAIWTERSRDTLCVWSSVLLREFLRIGNNWLCAAVALHGLWNEPQQRPRFRLQFYAHSWRLNRQHLEIIIVCNTSSWDTHSEAGSWKNAKQTIDRYCSIVVIVWNDSINVSKWTRRWDSEMTIGLKDFKIIY